MRVATGRGNDARKILTYYKVNYSLAAPYKVLVDGTIIQKSLQLDLYLKNSLPKLLDNSAQPVTTRCVVEELRQLGEDFSSAALFAKRLTRVPCGHSGGIISASDCIAATLANKNPHKLMLSSNDPVLLRKVSVEPSVPRIRLVGETRLVLLPPSAIARSVASSREASKHGVRRTDELRRLEEISAAERHEREERLASRTSKRKRAKGPNPLSVKKPRLPERRAPEPKHSETHDVCEAGNGMPQSANDECDDLTAKPRRVKRVRKRKPKPVTRCTDDTVTSDDSPGVGAGDRGHESTVEPSMESVES